MPCLEDYEGSLVEYGIEVRGRCGKGTKCRGPTEAKSLRLSPVSPASPPRIFSGSPLRGPLPPKGYHDPYLNPPILDIKFSHWWRTEATKLALARLDNARAGSAPFTDCQCFLKYNSSHSKWMKPPQQQPNTVRAKKDHPNSNISTFMTYQSSLYTDTRSLG